MKIMKHIFPLLLLLITAVATAQSKNPYKSIGKKGEVLTLTKGQYEELFDQDSIQQIGTVLINVHTMKVVELLNDEEAKERLQTEKQSRFLSVDPLTASYPELTPYQYASNSPIQNIDLDGLEGYYYGGVYIVHDAFLRKATIGVIEMTSRKAATAVMSAKEKTDEIEKIRDFKIITPPQSSVSSSSRANMSDYDKSAYREMKKNINESKGYDEDGNPRLLTKLGNNENWNKFADRVVFRMADIGTVMSVAGQAKEIAARALATRGTAEILSTGIPVQPVDITTSSKSFNDAFTYTIYRADKTLYKFGVDGMSGERLAQSLAEAGPGATYSNTSIVPKFQAHIYEKYLRSLQYNSTGQYSLPGMKVPYPINFETGNPIKPPTKTP